MYPDLIFLTTDHFLSLSQAFFSYSQSTEFNQTSRVNVDLEKYSEAWWIYFYVHAEENAHYHRIHQTSIVHQRGQLPCKLFLNVWSTKERLRLVWAQLRHLQPLGDNDCNGYVMIRRQHFAEFSPISWLLHSFSPLPFLGCSLSLRRSGRNALLRVEHLTVTRAAVSLPHCSFYRDAPVIKLTAAFALQS